MLKSEETATLLVVIITSLLLEQIKLTERNIKLYTFKKFINVQYILVSL